METVLDLEFFCSFQNYFERYWLIWKQCVYSLVFCCTMPSWSFQGIISSDERGHMVETRCKTLSCVACSLQRHFERNSIIRNQCLYPVVLFFPWIWQNMKMDFQKIIYHDMLGTSCKTLCCRAYRNVWNDFENSFVSNQCLHAVVLCYMDLTKFRIVLSWKLFRMMGIGRLDETRCKILSCVAYCNLQNNFESLRPMESVSAFGSFLLIIFLRRCRT